METRRRETKRRCGFANVSRLTSRLVSRLSSHVPALILTARLESAPYRAAGRLAPPCLALLYDDDEAFPDDVDAVLFHGDAAFRALAALLVQHERDVLGLLVPRDKPLLVADLTFPEVDRDGVIRLLLSPTMPLCLCANLLQNTVYHG